MPEGPEHYKAAVSINNWCEGRIFSGKVIKSDVSTKNPDVPFAADKYIIFAKSRGKEVLLTLCHCDNVNQKTLDNIDETKCANVEKTDTTTDTGSVSHETAKPVETTDNHANLKKCSIVFQFGMSGKFEFTMVNERHKHAHLMFFSEDMVLSFVDVRRFGRWLISDSFSTKKRGPDPVFEYKEFRKNVLDSLKKTVFQKPICEVLHDQRYFNGIGNYLRAEILYRAKIAPFEMASEVLSNLDPDKEDPKVKSKENLDDIDILDYCSIIPYEVMMLDEVSYDPNGDSNAYDAFISWLQCYYKPNMKNLIDGCKRTIWFQGPAGKLAPTGSKMKSRHSQSPKKEKNKVSKRSSQRNPNSKSSEKKQPLKNSSSKTAVKKTKDQKKTAGKKRSAEDLNSEKVVSSKKSKYAKVETNNKRKKNVKSKGLHRKVSSKKS